jgi:hypothetical protein
MLAGLIAAAAVAGSAAWSTGRRWLYGWWMSVLVCAAVDAVLLVVWGLGAAYWVVWLMLVGALAGAIREQVGRGSWWLVLGYEVLGPGAVLGAAVSGGLPMPVGVLLAAVCGVAGPLCLLPGFGDGRGVTR